MRHAKLETTLGYMEDGELFRSNAGKELPVTRTWFVELASSNEASPLFAADEGTRLHWTADRGAALAFPRQKRRERFGRNHFATDIRVAIAWLTA